MDNAKGDERHDRRRGEHAANDRRHGFSHRQPHQRRNERARPGAGAGQRDGDKQEKPDLAVLHDHFAFQMRPLLYLRDKTVQRLYPIPQKSENIFDKQDNERCGKQISRHRRQQRQRIIQPDRDPIRQSQSQLHHREHGDQEGHGKFPDNGISQPRDHPCPPHAKI